MGSLVIGYIMLALILLVNTVERTSVAQITNYGGNDINDISDEDRARVDRYESEPLARQVAEKECAKLEDPEACLRGEQQKTKHLGVDSEYISLAGLAYATVMGTANAKIDVEVSPEEPEAGEGEGRDPNALPGDGNRYQNGSQGTRTQKADWCVRIGLAGEALGKSLQGADGVLDSPTEGETRQKQVFYKAARAHTQSAHAAKPPALGWGGATACYGMMFAFQGATKTPGNMTKVAASSILSNFYWSESKRHEKYAKTMRRIAEKMPGKGDCNPITEPDCYCSFPEHANDPKYCLPNLHRQPIAKNSQRIPCVDNQLKGDPKCECLTSGTCLDSTFARIADLPDFGKAFLGSEIGRNIAKMYRGELTNGSLKTLARSKGALADIMAQHGDSIPDIERPLSAEQEKVAGEAIARGISPKVARHLALTSPSKKSQAAVKRFGGGQRRSVVRGARRTALVGGRGLSKRKKKASNSVDIKKLLNKNRKKKKRTSKVLRFNERALSSTQINKNKNANLFQIISRRYMLSGRKLLGVD